MSASKGKSFRHVVITGASSGIGAALAVHYAAAGVLLSLTGRNEERLLQVAGICRQRGAEIVTAVLDVTNSEAMQDWLLKCDRQRPVDLVIANAGISAGTGGGVMQGENPAQVRRLFAVNWDGVLNTVEPLLPQMIARGHGHIALMSSLAGFRGWPGAPAYCASKAAVKIYGEGLRGALAQTGVKIHVICPGFVESRMTAVNKFPMPFLMSAQKAAAIIARGIARDRGRIAFPLIPYILAWAFGAMPEPFAQAILGKMPAKAAGLRG